MGIHRYMIDTMSERHRRISPENPVGPEESPVKLDLPMWQVYVALLLIASGLTIYKFYESRYIAPNHVVTWTPLNGEAILSAHRQRELLIWVKSDNANQNQEIESLFADPTIRSAVYLKHLQTIQLVEPPGEASEIGTTNLLDKIRGGGLAYWETQEKEPVFLLESSIDATGLTKLLDESR